MNPFPLYNYNFYVYTFVIRYRHPTGMSPNVDPSTQHEIVNPWATTTLPPTSPITDLDTPLAITPTTLSSVGEVRTFMLEACNELVAKGVQLDTDDILSALQKCSTRSSGPTRATTTTDMLVQLVENNNKLLAHIIAQQTNLTSVLSSHEQDDSYSLSDFPIVGFCLSALSSPKAIFLFTNNLNR